MVRVPIGEKNRKIGTAVELFRVTVGKKVGRLLDEILVIKTRGVDCRKSERRKERLIER